MWFKLAAPPDSADSLDRLSRAEVLAFTRGLLAEMLGAQRIFSD